MQGTHQGSHIYTRENNAVITKSYINNFLSLYAIAVVKITHKQFPI